MTKLEELKLELEKADEAWIKSHDALVDASDAFSNAYWSYRTELKRLKKED
tara:strand:- start:442 stop:594 length:153 start_codon:yes stop_codon:yes gene_type:complete